MQLNTSYEPKVDIDGDQLKPSDIANHPLIVKVHEHRTGITTKYSPDGDGTAVLVDVLDLTSGNVSINVLWFNGAIVDNLVGYVGQDALAIKIVYKEGKNGNSYLIPQALADNDLQTAVQWAQSRPTIFEDTRAERGIEPHGGALGGGALPAMGGATTQAAPQAQQAPQAAPAPQAQQVPQQAPAAPPAAFGPESNPAPAQQAPPAAPAPQAAQPQQQPMPVQGGAGTVEAPF